MPISPDGSDGFSHSFSLGTAIKKAEVELFRNRNVLKNSFGKKASGINDQRLLYFSTIEGFQHFKARLKSIVKAPSSIPDLIVDKAVKGQWDRYSSVWRCLLPDTAYQWHDEKHFMF